MSLLDFQTALGRAVRAPTGNDPLDGMDLDADERARLAALIASPGFRFTVEVQRSWSAGRAGKSARLTLSIIPSEERNRLLDAWVGGGGGTASFIAAEAGAFLDFIAAHLPDPSHALTLCRVEQATLRASRESSQFDVPDLSRLDAGGCALRAGGHAALVWFHTEPRRLLAALGGQPLPPLSPNLIPMLFGPGLAGLCREATTAEVALWGRLGDPVSVAALLQEGCRRETIEALVVAGCAEISDATGLEASKHPSNLFLKTPERNP